MVNKQHIKAALTYLEWSYKKLSEVSGVSESTIKDFLSNGVTPRVDTYSKINTALLKNNIQVNQDGYKVLDKQIVTLEGDDWYLKALDDVFVTLSNGGEFLCMYSDDAVSPPPVNDSIRKIRSLPDVSMRQLVREGDTYLMGDLSEYRYVPSEFFDNNVILIYGQKVLLCLADGTEGLIIKAPALADIFRKDFEYKWKMGEKPEVSHAKEKY